MNLGHNRQSITMRASNFLSYTPPMLDRSLMKNVTIMTTTRTKFLPSHLQGYRTIHHRSSLPISIPTTAPKMSSVPTRLNYPCHGQQRLVKPQALRKDSVADDIFYDFVRAEEIEAAHKIEVQGFPPDEADAVELLKFHQQVAPDLFLGAYVSTSPSSSGVASTSQCLHRRLVAYVFATLSPIPRYTQQSMISHIPNTTTVCCHTLCVDKDFRGLSIGMKLFGEFTHMCRKRGIYDRMLFIAKGKSLPVYEKFGSMTLGPAEVKLGKDVWHEMCINFRE